MLSVNYADGDAVRIAVEKGLKRALRDSEWSTYRPDWTGPYDDADVAEIINTVRDSPTQSSKPSPEENARKGRLAHVERVVRQTKELVEEYRMELFGHAHPPYPNRGSDAAEWIESQVETPIAERLNIEVTIPTQLKPMERLVWVIEHLSSKLDSWSSTGNGDGAVAHFMKHSGEVRDIG